MVQAANGRGLRPLLLPHAAAAVSSHGGGATTKSRRAYDEQPANGRKDPAWSRRVFSLQRATAANEWLRLNTVSIPVVYKSKDVYPSVHIFRTAVLFLRKMPIEFFA